MNGLGRTRLLLDLRVGAVVLVGHLALASAVADEQPAATRTTKGMAPDGIVYVPRESAASDQLMGGLVRVPLDFGAPKVSVAGGVRAVRSALPTVQVLAPPKLAHSLTSQPTLYWYLSGPSTAPVRLSVQGIEDAEPSLEVELGQAPMAGVYATALADYGIELEPGRLYRWSVALEVDPQTYPEEPIAHTIFATSEADPALSGKLAGEPTLEQIQTLAKSGYWYDAIDLLTQQMVTNDASAPWRDLHAALLDQVGLKAIAAFERGGTQ